MQIVPANQKKPKLQARGEQVAAVESVQRPQIEVCTVGMWIRGHRWFRQLQRLVFGAARFRNRRKYPVEVVATDFRELPLQLLQEHS